MMKLNKVMQYDFLIGGWVVLTTLEPATGKCKTASGYTYGM